MSNVSQQYQQQQPPTNATNSVYYGTTGTAYQQSQHAGTNGYGNNGPSSSQHMTYWNRQSGGYTNNQTGNYFTGTSHPASTAHQSSHWFKTQNCQPNSACYVPNPGVATSNRNGIKRTYYTDAPLHDITNNAHNSASQPKRRKFTMINTHTSQVLQKGVHRNITIVPHAPASTAPASFDPSAGKVRIESIFRHVELLAQSYWQTGCPASTVFKPATVDAFEGGIPTH